MTQGIKFGDYLICTRSSCGNEGKIVRVIDEEFDSTRPEYKDWLFHPDADIVVDACGTNTNVRVGFVSEKGDIIEAICDATQLAVCSYNYRNLEVLYMGGVATTANVIDGRQNPAGHKNIHD